MSRFLDFLVRAYAPLAARHALLDPALAPMRERSAAREPSARPCEITAIRPSVAPPAARRRPSSLAA